MSVYATPATTSFVTTHNDIYPAIDPTNPSSNLAQPSKVILITGAGRGIGRSIALRYAESAVSSIILCARTTAQLDAVEAHIKTIRATIRTHKFPLDVADTAAVAAVAAAVRHAEGRLDILVNNAGISMPWVPIAESAADDFASTMAVNVNGPYNMTRALLPLLLETAERQGGVDIVNLSSVGAHTVFRGASAYQTSKFALNRLTEFTQVEYGSRGVNCVAVNPGGVVTDMSKDNEMIAAWLNDTVELPGGFVVWLTKGDKTWLNGRYVSAAWDVTELEARKEEIVQKDLLKMRMVT